MKTHLISSFLLALVVLSTGVKAQRIEGSFRRSTLHWNEDITITDANLAVLQNADITTSGNITINVTAASGRNVELSNTKIVCNQIVITSDDVKMSHVTLDCSGITFANTNIMMENVTINCPNITFAHTANTLTITKLAKVNGKKIVFVAPVGSSPANFSIKNNGTTELSIIGVLQRNGRDIVFAQLENFKVNIQEN